MALNCSKQTLKLLRTIQPNPVKFLGKFEETIETRKRVTVATFYVTKTSNSENLISATTAQELGLDNVSLHLKKLSQEHVNFVTRNSVPKAMTLEEVEAATNQDETLKDLNGHTITCNVSQFKQIPKPKTTDVETDDDDLYNNTNNTTNNNTNNEQPQLRRSSRVRGRPDRYGL
jgi:hypothetical protein